MGAAASAVIAPITGAIGYGLTYIKDTPIIKNETLALNIKRVTKVIETNKIARIFAGIFTCGLTELINHREESVQYFYEDEFIGDNDKDAAEVLYEKGNKFYEKGDYETAAIWFARASNLTKDSGNEKYKESLKRVKQKIKDEAERKECEEAARREREKIKREEDERARIQSNSLLEEATRRETAKRKREADRQAREEALRLERARTQSKSLLEEAINIYQQAEALNSLELKLEKYEMALSKCKELCASGATEAAFNTMNKIFESCLKHDAHDEAEGAVQIARKYFPSKAGHLQQALVSQQNESWSPHFESRARRQQEQEEQNRTIMIMLS